MKNRISLSNIFYLLIITIFFATQSSLNASALGKIAGHISDEETGGPLPGVNVVVVGSEIGAASDNMGDFFIPNLPPGKYSIKISMIGYQTITINDIQVFGNKTTDVDVKLGQEVLEGQAIQVTAERKIIQLDNTSTTMTLVSEDIVDQPTSEIEDVLTSLPSVNVENGEVKIRGGTLDEVAFVIDGTRSRNPMDHSPYTNINLSSISELEVITGAFNAEYGEARSGIVNVITKEGGDIYEMNIDTRYMPPGIKHWGVSLYDQNTDLYWENRNARHLEWWIENTDMWVDNSGNYGFEPDCEQTPEEAYEQYMRTHQPLNDYTNLPSYETEISLGGPVPLLNGLKFFVTGKYQSMAPLYGNSFRDKGEFFNGTYKLTLQPTSSLKISLSGFYGAEKTSWGVSGYPDFWYALTHGIDSRYAYYDFPGLPESQTSGQSIIMNYLLSENTLFELKLSRLNAVREVNTFPGDSIGWDAGGAEFDNLRALEDYVYYESDTLGNIDTIVTRRPVPGAYSGKFGYHTTGYYFRYKDNNTEYSISGFLSSHLNKVWSLKAGFEFQTYILDHFNQSKFPSRRDDNVYKPMQGALYYQNKVELGGFIMNLGLRFDFYNVNDKVYTDLFDPFNKEIKNTKWMTQLSPRLGVSHPINENTVLHFSYGHFLQRPSFGDYGEGNSAQGSLTTFVVDDSDLPWVLGNREMNPEKTVAFEAGIERNIGDMFLLDISGFYKDIRNTVRSTTIETPTGSYSTNGNGDYADMRGTEISLNMLPAKTRIGDLWGYVNYSSQNGITGYSGDPIIIRYDGTVRYAPSGDFINRSNPYFKAGLFYRSPHFKSIADILFGGVTLSLNYTSVLPNKDLRQDYIYVDNKKYVRKPDGEMKLRLRKEFVIGSNKIRIQPYLEVHNLLNEKWVFFSTIESASIEDQIKFVESDYEDVPTHNSDGVPFMESAKYRNLPRSIILGLTMNIY